MCKMGARSEERDERGGGMGLGAHSARVPWGREGHDGRKKGDRHGCGMTRGTQGGRFRGDIVVVEVCGGGMGVGRARSTSSAASDVSAASVTSKGSAGSESEESGMRDGAVAQKCKHTEAFMPESSKSKRCVSVDACGSMVAWTQILRRRKGKCGSSKAQSLEVAAARK